ncbi:Ankyrin repeat protein [Giardia duodenalis]|uniref:Protein 21.1 n=2 Tax=Giardia intestinalis TaxID=5741 RepID=C6LRU5_GIAIB|nr:Protein 21.1 [Giardia intestinalis ATCC 50581]ESU44991.1 Ankyrin repeat protein [Giardia intestinalis]
MDKLSWFRAAYLGDVEFVRLNRSKFRKAVDKWGRTALMYASRAGHFDVLELLLSDEIGLISNDGITALVASLKGDYIDIFVRLYPLEQQISSKGQSLTKLSITYNAPRCLRFLLENEYLEDVRGADGKTALELALIRNHFKIVELLMSKFTYSWQSLNKASLFVKQKNLAKFEELVVQHFGEVLPEYIKKNGSDHIFTANNEQSYLETSETQSSVDSFDIFSDNSNHQLDIATDLRSRPTTSLSSTNTTANASSSELVDKLKLQNTELKNKQDEERELMEVMQQHLSDFQRIKVEMREKLQLSLSTIEDQKREIYVLRAALRAKINTLMEGTDEDVPDSVISMGHEELRLSNVEDLLAIMERTKYIDDDADVEKDVQLAMLEERLREKQDEVSKLEDRLRISKKDAMTQYHLDDATASISYTNAGVQVYDCAESTLIEELNSSRATIEDLTARLAESLQKSTTLKEQLSSLECSTRNADADGVLEASVRVMEYELNKLRSSNALLSQNLEKAMQAEPKYIAMEMEQNVLMQKLSSAEDSNRRMMRELATYQEKIATLESTLSEERTLKTANAEIDLLQKKNRALESQLQNLKRSLISYGSVERSNRTEQESIINKHKVLLHKYESLRATYTQLEMKYQLMEKELNTYRTYRTFQSTINSTYRPQTMNPFARTHTNEHAQLTQESLSTSDLASLPLDNVDINRTDVHRSRTAVSAWRSPSLDGSPSPITHFGRYSAKRSNWGGGERGIRSVQIPRTRQPVDRSSFDHQVTALSSMQTGPVSLAGLDPLVLEKPSKSILYAPNVPTDLMTAVVNSDREQFNANSNLAGEAMENGVTALMLAAEHNEPEFARLLIQYEAGMSRADGRRAIDIAISAQNYAIADMLIPYEGYSSGELVRIGGRRTELMEAALRNDIVRVYCFRHVQGGLRDMSGFTALMYSAEKGHTDAVKILLDIEKKITNTQGVTALMLAAVNNKVDAVNILKNTEACMRNSEHHTALMLAARANHPMIVEALIELEGGMCVEAAGLVGSRVSALMYAAYYGYGMCVSLLAPVEHSLVDKNGLTALDWAINCHKNVDPMCKNRIIQILQQYHASIG